MGTASNEALAILEVGNSHFNLTLGRYLIGSGPHCDIVIDDSTVEKHHAFLVVQQHAVKIIDLLTDSGTYVDDEKVCNGKFNDNLKSASIKFGSVDAQFRLIEESDSGFLGFTSRDASDIIPLSPQECSTVRHNSEMGRSRIRSIKSSFQSEFRIPDPPSIGSPRDDRLGCNDIFLANVTDINIRRNIEQMSEEDDYYVPETQEIFGKRPQSPRDDTNEGIFRITTQEFEEDSEISKPSQSNLSMVIPLIRHSPILVNELKEESPSGSTSKSKTPPEQHGEEVDIKTDNETESEISILKWDESKNNSSATGRDLEAVKFEEQIKDGSVTPDLELITIRSGSTTPDLFPENETSAKTNIDIEKLLFSPTQIFKPKESVATKSNISSNKVPLNVSSNNPDADIDLEVTQPFIIRQNTNQLRSSKSPDLLKNVDAIFARPLPKPPLTIDADSDEYDNAEPTQPFKLKAKSKPSTSMEEATDDDDFDQFAATQRFELNKQKNRSISPAVVSLSDEDISNEEFCLKETLDIGEIEKNVEKPSGSSKKKGISTKEPKKVAEEDDLFADIQPTPCMNFLKLPNESAIDNVERFLNKKTNNRRRRVSLFPSSSDEDDDDVFNKETVINSGKSKKNAEDQKNIVVWLKRDRKSDETLKQQKLLLDIPEDVKKKDSVSNQLTSSDDAARQRRGGSKKRRKSDDKGRDKSAKQTKISASSNSEKLVEDVVDKSEKTPDDVIQKRRGRPRKHTENTDDESKKTQEEKKETRSKKCTTSKKKQMRATSEKPTLRPKRNSKKDDTKSEYGDSVECQRNLDHRTNKRVRSIPVYIADYFTEIDRKQSRNEVIEKIRKSKEIHKASRGETVTKKLKQDQTNLANPQKRISDTNLDVNEANKKSKEEVLRCSTEKNLVYTSTPSVRKSARQAKHRICFTRVDSSPYADVIQKTGCKIENDPITSTVLVAAKITRTWKMLVAIAKGLPIVSPDWFNVLESNYNDSFSYDEYLLQDPSAERQYKFNLKKSLKAARKKPIFENFTFFITPQTQPNPVEMTKIIESGGGNVTNRFPRHERDFKNFYIISNREDQCLWKNFKSAETNVSIYSSEAVMSAVMQQCINFKPHQLS